METVGISSVRSDQDGHGSGYEIWLWESIGGVGTCAGSEWSVLPTKDNADKSYQKLEKCSQSTFRSVAEISLGGVMPSGPVGIDMDKALKGLLARDPPVSSVTNIEYSEKVGDLPSISSGKFRSEFHISGNRIPLDLTLKTTMRLVSSSSVKWCHRLSTCGSNNGLGHYASPFDCTKSQNVGCSSGIIPTAEALVVSIDLSFARNGFSQDWYPNASLFGQFTKLKKLFLTENDITGWVNPQGYWGLQNLEQLDLSGNQIESVGSWIFNITSARSIDLSNNMIKDLPSDLCQLQDLQGLDLSENSMKGNIDTCLKSEIPSQLVKLHWLSVFRVAYNNLSGIIPYKDQFCTFNKSSFEGNPGLSEVLIEKNCWSMHGTSQTYHDSSNGDHEDTWKAIDNEVIFYSFIAASFAIGFWGVIVVLAFNKNGRIKFFMAADDFLYACMDVILGLIKRIEKCICK
ncbi:hypothetical protein QJS10_CPB19g01258 [Acorus calamus]|uniref:Uncharacterized protein n=1 Tax=Acorus calamus TaxID=4465 RepID=A0AAV9CGW7_ACOCL|nr:hypothetical protein QJS10_CPB19g01258 [Acorus calamus]